MHVELLEYGQKLVEGYYNLSEDSTVHQSVKRFLIYVFVHLVCFIYDRVRYAAISGTKYSKGYLIPCYVENDMPVLGEVMDIIILLSSKCLFVLKPYISTTFNCHFHAFEVFPVEEYLFYHQNELTDFHPLFISKSL